MAITNAMAKQFSAKTVFTISGKTSNIPGACVNPKPKLKEKAKTVRFLFVSPQRLNISNTLTMMFANIINVQPPKTGLGSVAIKAPNTGNNPAKS